MDKEKARAIAARMDELLRPLEQEFGVRARVRSGSLSEGVYQARVEIGKVDPEGKVACREAEDFKLLARAYGLDPQDQGKTFTNLGEEYRLIGIRRGAPKYPFLCERARDGKRFSFPEAVARLLNGERVKEA